MKPICHTCGHVYSSLRARRGHNHCVPCTQYPVQDTLNFNLETDGMEPPTTDDIESTEAQHARFLTMAAALYDVLATYKAQPQEAIALLCSMICVAAIHRSPPLPPEKLAGMILAYYEFNLAVKDDTSNTTH